MRVKGILQTTVTCPLSLSNRLREMIPTDFWEAKQAVRGWVDGHEKDSHRRNVLNPSRPCTYSLQPEETQDLDS